jgi:2-polyprenyl-3-methyl-5-hydroxy-6-metoxy-1,4-benzoquinol methylase
MNVKIFNSKNAHDSYWKDLHGGLSSLDDSPRIRIAREWLFRLKPRRILDIGCGPGNLARSMKAESARLNIDGLDFSPVALDEAGKYLDNCLQTDIDQSDIPAQDGIYDAVCCLETVEHVYDVDHLLREINRVLAASGRALISVPNLAYWRYRVQLFCGILPHPEVTDAKHLHFFTYASLKEKARAAGLDVSGSWGYSERARLAVRLWPSLFSSTVFLEFKKRQTDPKEASA